MHLLLQTSAVVLREAQQTSAVGIFAPLDFCSTQHASAADGQGGTCHRAGGQASGQRRAALCEQSRTGEAEQDSSEQACCELCEGGVHSKEDCPLVVAAQECTCAATPEAEGADWQVVPGKASKTQAKGNKRGKGTKGGKGSKANKGKGHEKKSGHATKVVLAHKDGLNGWVPVKEASGKKNGSGSKQPEFT